VMRCACGNAVARGGDLVSMAAPDAERTFTSVALGSHATVNATVSRLRNPHGDSSDLVTVAQASGVTAASHRPSSTATWFPGYAWQIRTCSVGLYKLNAVDPYYWLESAPPGFNPCA
jgi:hypothetical protein